MSEIKCPAKRSPIHPETPPRLCLECGNYEYAAHLKGVEWMKPAIELGRCPNHVPRMRPGVSGVNH